MNYLIIALILFITSIILVAIGEQISNETINDLITSLGCLCFFISVMIVLIGSAMNMAVTGSFIINKNT